jgi:hypothetical protein
MSRWLARLYLYAVIIGGILILIEIHTGKVSEFYNAHLKPKKEQKLIFVPIAAEEDPEILAGRWEAFLQHQDFDKVIEETEWRKDPLSRVYYALAILESGEHPSRLVDAITIVLEVIKMPDIPDDLKTRLVTALGDPEAPGPTPEENLRAYKEIIKDLNIATHPSSLRKLRELESEL